MHTRSSGSPPQSEVVAAASGKKSKPRCQWLPADETAFIEFLVENHQNGMTDNAMFKDGVFRAAAEHVNRNIQRGAPKTMESCKGKWSALKKKHEVINMLKAKSGFIWDDETGMGVTPDRQGEWQELVNSNKDFAPYENSGWPHCDAMDQMVPSKAKGQHAYRGTQQARAGSASTSLTPFESVPSSSSAKRKQFAFDIADQPTGSSSSKRKRTKTSEGISAINNLTGMFGGLRESIRERPDSSLGPAARAAQRLLSHAREPGNEWLSLDEACELLELFRSDEQVAQFYLAIAGADDQSLVRKWLRGRLASAQSGVDL